MQDLDRLVDDLMEQFVIQHEGQQHTRAEWRKIWDAWRYSAFAYAKQAERAGVQ